jgi:hypothetical protein
MRIFPYHSTINKKTAYNPLEYSPGFTLPANMPKSHDYSNIFKVYRSDIFSKYKSPDIIS